jgi:hypothetical protein
MDACAASDSFLGCLARRGRNAQHHRLPRRHYSFAFSNRTCSAPQEAVRLVRTLHTPPPNRSIWPLPRSSKFPSRKCNPQHLPQNSDVAHRLSCKRTAFSIAIHILSTTPTRRKRTPGAWLRRFLRNATRKMPVRSPHLLCCALRPLCLVSGTLLSNRQRSFRLFNDNLN